MRNPWFIVGLLALVLFGGGILFSSQVEQDKNKGIELRAHVIGNPDADIKLVEYSDFQCPACAMVQPILKEVLQDYGDKISLEFKHFPIGAPRAAVAAEAAGQQGKFFEFHDLLYSRQPEWSSDARQESHFLRYAEELELDMEQFKLQMDSSALLRKVMADRSEGVALVDENGKSLIEGTPTFFLNGNKMVYTSYEDFLTQIIQAIDPSLIPPVETSDSNTDVRFGF
jgi:protein-disulfide isomerase